MRPPNGFGDEHGGLKVQAHASVFLRNRASEESQFTGFAHQARNEAFFLVVDFFEFRNDALFDKVQRHLLHHQLLLRPFFRDEDVGGCGGANQKFTASDRC